MATCKDCIHYFACSANGGLFNDKDETKEMLCNHFKNKVDFVEVVRCKDCKYCFDAIMGGMWCEHPDDIMPLGSNPTDFCSYGVKKEVQE